MLNNGEKCSALLTVTAHAIFPLARSWFRDGKIRSESALRLLFYVLPVK